MADMVISPCGRRWVWVRRLRRFEVRAAGWRSASGEVRIFRTEGLTLIHGGLTALEARAGVLAGAIVGRHRERRRLADALHGAATAGPRVVVVGGDAGVGKTCLMDHFGGDAADAGALVLTGACVAFGGDGLPLAPITAALRGLVRQLGKAALPAELAFLVPELASPGTPPPDQARLFHLIGVLFERLGTERPVVLVIEDLHWADRSTLGLLDVLSRAQRGARVLIVLTYRTDEPRPAEPLRSVLAEVDRLPGVERIDLAALSRAETAELIAGITGEAAAVSTVDRVYNRSGGNAFFVEELVQAGRAGTVGLGRSMGDLLLSRVDQLPDPAQRAVRAVAVGGRKVSHRLVAVAAGMPDETLLAGLRGAV